MLKDVRRLEAVQRRFTKKLEGLHSLIYRVPYFTRFRTFRGEENPCWFVVRL